MKLFLLLIAICAGITVQAQRILYGKRVRNYDSIVIDGKTYQKGGQFAIDNGRDGVTIHSVVLRAMDGDSALFVESKKGLVYPLDAKAREWVQAAARGPMDTMVTSTGFQIGKGQKLKVGMGTNPDGDFRFIRINSASMFRYGGTDRRGVNAANAAPAAISGLECSVIRIERRTVPNHGGVNYVIINSPSTGLIRYEIDVENAIKTGEIEVPEMYKPQRTQGSTIVQPLSVADELLKFKKLLDSGVITQAEYDAQKKKLLGQ